MIKIAIQEKDAFYRHGMEILLQQIFLINLHKLVEIKTLTRESLVWADIIVKRYDAGAKFICQPSLMKRKANSLIIGVDAGRDNKMPEDLPLCISNIVFINYNETVEKARCMIISAWESCTSAPYIPTNMSCFSCKHRTLTPQQLSVACHFYLGHSPQATARMLSIAPKTVAAHKRSIMEKFDIRTDCELLNFIKILLKNEHTSELIKNTINTKLNIIR